MTSSCRQCSSSTNPPSKRTLCDAEPFRPSESPQSSSISHDERGATNSIGFVSPGTIVWPMKCVDHAMPDEYGHVPVRCQPPSTGTASPTGAPKEAAKKCSLSSASCASSG